MGQIMQYVRIADPELTHLRQLMRDDPDKAYEYADELADSGDDDVPEHSRGMDIDKAWDGLAFLLTGVDTVTVDVVRGGVRLTEDEWGYEPPRYLGPDEVALAARELDHTPFYRLALRFDPAAMTDVYPMVWGEEFALDYLRGWYERLTRFVRSAAADRHGLLLYLS